jgi:GNAT superfamily N-acetyltransferase
MTEMTNEELVAAVDANYFASFRLMCEAAGKPVHESGGVLSCASGAPAAFLNIAFVTRRLERPEEALTESMAFFDGLGLPFVVRIREGVDPAAERAAERLGMPYSDTVPGMALPSIPSSPPLPAGLAVRIVRPGPDVARFQGVVAEGFGMPIELARELFTEKVLAGVPAMEAYLGLVDGLPVATSTLVRTDAVAGVYNVATLDTHRRRGIGEALTWYAIERGAEAGCTMAALQASEMGQPVYERMGFRVVAPYRTFHRPGV